MIDIKTAFLNGPLSEEIYMKKPDILGEGYWRLHKGLYGLKQAGRAWYLELNERLSSLGFSRCESDWSVHMSRSSNGKSLTATSVDDILLSAPSQVESDRITDSLRNIFDLTDGGNVEFLLGCSIARDRKRRCLLLCQEAYIESILRSFNLHLANAVSTPLPPKLILTSKMAPQNDEERQLVKDLPYCTLVGKVMYLATTSRPDIAYAVRELAKFMTNFGSAHWEAAKHLLRYLRGTSSRPLILGHLDNPYPLLRGFTDSDWGMGEDRKSISGYVMMLGNSPIAWSSKNLY